MAVKASLTRRSVKPGRPFKTKGDNMAKIVVRFCAY
jgi:hypothetical protein